MIQNKLEMDQTLDEVYNNMSILQEVFDSTRDSLHLKNKGVKS